MHLLEILALDASQTIRASWWWARDIPELFDIKPIVEVIGQFEQSFLNVNRCNKQFTVPYVLLCIHAPSPSGEAVKENTSVSPRIWLPWHLWYCTIFQNSCSVTERTDVMKTVSNPPKKNPSIFFVFSQVLHIKLSQWACGSSFTKNL